MARRGAPSLPTQHQIKEVHEAVAALHPGARIARVGPEGIEFYYPDNNAASGADWRGKPFSAEGG